MGGFLGLSWYRDFIRMAFAYTGIQLEFQGEGVDEVGFVKSIDTDKAQKYNLDLSKLQKLVGETVIAVDPRYFRPTEVDLLIGDPTKAETKLGWTREHILEDLVNDMMASDIKLMTKDQYLQDGGYRTNNYYE